MVHDRKNIDQIKKSIKKFNDDSQKAKESLTDSIEMFWLNAGIQKKKQDVKPVHGKNEQISRIRQLLAAAWSEDLKD
jgi:ATP-dependent Clp protease ATP-binding subunit ClpA